MACNLSWISLYIKPIQSQMTSHSYVDPKFNRFFLYILPMYLDFNLLIKFSNYLSKKNHNYSFSTIVRIEDYQTALTTS